MRVGIIGLGRMGEAIAYRAVQAGHEVIGFDTNLQACKQAKKEGVEIANSLKDLVYNSVEVIWFMVPPGQLIDDLIAQLEPHLSSDIIIIDGGNSRFTDSKRRAYRLAQKDISFLDCGTSGGLQGRKNGFCLMVGGLERVYTRVVTLLKAIAAPEGYAHVGPSGAGHYVKMIHNGIEYALLQAYAEGFHLLKEGAFKKDNLDLVHISHLWNHGSVIRSWILELVHEIMIHDQDFTGISGEIESTGMGEWMVQEANEQNVSVPVIEKSLYVRAVSKETGGDYGTKIVAMLRKAFGGHRVKKIG